ncbi:MULTISPECIES: hypothetical protein [unclassified Methylobacterium]|uniref:hypothetical protein n=1 Tax=unclassified Methylobacterium TaxID=2615210 RepID=UPI0008E1ABAD|nr:MULTISPECIES: hypothetical protein [unclassified Methylobacterium]SFV09883.1 hypothetical protein SAMN02799643_05175 [Methylobacterium sp. UNCCL125]
MRIIASMTTIPSRIAEIEPVIASVLNQDVAVDHLEINIPFHCKRNGEEYILPDWLVSEGQIAVFRTDDYGPITKIAPTLLRHRHDDAYIWSVDDDCRYPRNQLRLLTSVCGPNEDRILTRYGGNLKEGGLFEPWYGHGACTMLEGFGGVLYPPNCIKDDFDRYLVDTSNDKFCRANDDIVLAMYFNHHQVPIFLHNVPSDDVPYMVEGWMAHADRDALSTGGHNVAYEGAYKFITNYFICNSS